MPTYVYSMRRPGAVAHIGSPDRLRCGLVLRSFFQTTAQYPAGHRLCGTCARLTGAEQEKVIRFHSFLAERDAFFVNLLRQGLTNDGIVRRLNISQRSVSRYLNEAMYRAKAVSRFHWGYKVGYLEGVRDGVGYVLLRHGVWAAPGSAGPIPPSSTFRFVRSS